MWLLIVLCTSVACDADLVAVHTEVTEKRCRELGNAVYAEMGYTFMCALDRTAERIWEEFE